MVDYGKLIEEEKARRDSILSQAEKRRIREIEVVAFFREVEIEIGKEMAKANLELKKRGSPTITGPFRPNKDQELIELAFGARNPCCVLALVSSDPVVGLSRIHAALMDEKQAVIGQTDFVIEGEVTKLKAYRALVEGFPDHHSEADPAGIAREIVPGIIRGRFVYG